MFLQNTCPGTSTVPSSLAVLDTLFLVKAGADKNIEGAKLRSVIFLVSSERLVRSSCEGVLF